MTGIYVYKFVIPSSLPWYLVHCELVCYSSMVTAIAPLPLSDTLQSNENL